MKLKQNLDTYFELSQYTHCAVDSTKCDGQCAAEHRFAGCKPCSELLTADGKLFDAKRSRNKVKDKGKGKGRNRRQLPKDDDLFR